MVDTSAYKVGVVVSLEGCGGKSKSGKALKACQVNIGEDEPIAVVTSASNVRENSRVVVAPVGSTFVNAEGEEQNVTKATVGGVASEGMLCDSRMLGWSGGGVGVAAQVPDSFEVGSAPPLSKPGAPKKAELTEEEMTAAKPAPGLYEKKPTKEEKKRLAEERRKARKAAKEAKAKMSS
uniref:tRNA-binding domain-containing protein n=1 Tax=Helicotheca tamesis TaxID=374047 RepID=A0A7S2HDZ5_9STRA|mmetsp:Transcript_17294/g.23824  ORF Transcript_17294/g.23824 Transcript_17294/m.23824 type:complete len:179 (+) Transcript_17294:157-693(+)|eukprot:CAMPEP_0185729000 /NCGR_PEP_ID=MMETSP1171-20130828/4413_1 /TAXON_ID=374046 /ORGANISM="Helicotheca tamensis, Strain CCMP826" /LENGTH=178 /DNA_ID=CAMNT_0028397763 /DNA_START=111 /DNA_END=647 /DNA_ORIENTATION=-